MSNLDRRSFLKHTAIAAGAVAISGLGARSAKGAYGHLQAGLGDGGYGELYPTRSANTGELCLELPQGFRYTVLGRTGSIMSDGNPTPRAHDGMAAFSDGDTIRLVRNHEINNQRGQPGASIAGNAPGYDHSAGGGTTTLVIDPSNRELIEDFVSLNGSLHNCAGGPTPWGTWITCEETTMGRTIVVNKKNKSETGGFDQDHGYCIEVDAMASGPQEARPIRSMGRFVHEAIAVDPATSIVYETEDHNYPDGSGFYRYIPDVPQQLARGGKLQMLAIKSKSGYDTRIDQVMGAELPVTWVTIDEPDPSDASTDASSVFKQGHAKGGASFNRLEGCWYGDGNIFFTSTNGGDQKLGQVWQYAPAGAGDGILKLLFESPDKALLRAPDNICVSPRGGLVICEDSAPSVYVRGLTSEGRVFDVAKDLAGIEVRGEFAGATFSPDGETLFVNMQRPGLTYAIWGPWHQGAI